MNEGILLIVSVLLGPVVTALVEATKLLAKTKLGESLTGNVKLKVALVTSFVVGAIATVVTGAVNPVAITQEIVALVYSDIGFWAFFPAMAVILKDVALVVAVVTAVSQGVYALLEKRLKEAGWLAA